MTKRVIIDTDPGVDDCAAILLALASPELQVDALTISYGNGSMPPVRGQRPKDSRSGRPD